MGAENLDSVRSVRVIVVANEKGGSGKSTVAIHVAIALMRAGLSVATIDLDARQRTFTHYVDNRLSWCRQKGRDLPTPTHVCFDEEAELAGEGSPAEALLRTIVSLSENHGCIIIDTPGHNSELGRIAHGLADTLITPLNDSFVDLDTLGSVDPENFRLMGISHYAQLVEEARRARRDLGNPDLDWIVLRNRLSNLNSRNKKFVGEALDELAQQLGFRCIEGLAERVIFREFYPRGLTALDDLDEGTLGTRPTLSHVSAQLEVQGLLATLLGLPVPAESAEGAGEFGEVQAA